MNTNGTPFVEVDVPSGSGASEVVLVNPLHVASVWPLRPAPDDQHATAHAILYMAHDSDSINIEQTPAEFAARCRTGQAVEFR